MLIAKSLSRPLEPELARECAIGGDFVRVLAKGLMVIESFNAQASAMTLSDGAKCTGLSRGTARRTRYCARTNPRCSGSFPDPASRIAYLASNSSMGKGLEKR